MRLFGNSCTLDERHQAVKQLAERLPGAETIIAKMGVVDAEYKYDGLRTKGLVVDHKPARVWPLIEPSVWLEPKMVLEVLADEITRSPIHTAGKVGDEPGYALRFPRLVAFREQDKKPEDATTVEELIEKYHSQHKK